MTTMGAFEREGGALVWRRGTAGCAVAMGWATLLFGVLWGGAATVGVVRTGEPLAAVFAVLGAMMALFGLVMATLRSEVRVDREVAIIRRSVIVTVSEARVPVRGCHAVIAVRNLVGTPRAPQSAAQRRYVPTVSVGLLTPSGFVALATELEGPQTEASLATAVQALSAVTGLPAQDHRASAAALLADLRAWRTSRAVPIVVATMAVGLVLAGLVAAAVVAAGSLDRSASSSPRVGRHAR